MMKRLYTSHFYFIVFYLCVLSVQAQKNHSLDTKLYNLESISNIDTIHLHSYYKIKKYYSSVYDSHQYFNAFESEGTLIYQLFIVCPVYHISKATDYTAEDTLMMFQNEDFSYRKSLKQKVDTSEYAYVGYVFEKPIDSNLNDSQKEMAKDLFVKQAISECYEIRYKKKVEYFERIDSGYEYESYIQALGSNNKKKPIVFIPKYTPFK